MVIFLLFFQVLSFSRRIFNDYSGQTVRLSITLLIKWLKYERLHSLTSIRVILSTCIEIMRSNKTTLQVINEHVTGIRWLGFSSRSVVGFVSFSRTSRYRRARETVYTIHSHAFEGQEDDCACQRPAHKNIRRAKNEKKCSLLHTHTHHIYIYIYTLFNMINVNN